jgi:hypothetical protein
MLFRKLISLFGSHNHAILQLESVLVAALTPTCSAFFRSLGILGGVVGLTAADPQRSWALGGHGEHGRRQALA